MIPTILRMEGMICFMRNLRFTFLLSADERSALDHLATLWRRSRGDLMRLLIADALSRLFTDDQQSAGRGPNSAAEFTSGMEGSHD